MKLYTTVNNQTIALDALIHLSEVQSDDGGYYFSDAVCIGKFALCDKPITIELATYPYEGD